MNETDNIARGNHVVPTEWAQQLERERDEAREEVSSIRNMLSRNGEAVGNGEHNFSIIEMVENLLQSKDYFVRKSDSLERERDEAREALVRSNHFLQQSEENLESIYKERDEAQDKAERYRLEANAMMMQRDEARKHLEDVKEYGTEEINAAVELRQKLATALVERDETREDADHWKIEYEIVVSRLCGVKHDRDNGVIFEHEIIPKLQRERDEAREELHDIRLNLGEDADGYTLLHAVCVLQNKRDEARAVSD